MQRVSAILTRGVVSGVGCPTFERHSDVFVYEIPLSPFWKAAHTRWIASNCGVDLGVPPEKPDSMQFVGCLRSAVAVKDDMSDPSMVKQARGCWINVALEVPTLGNSAVGFRVW